MCSMSDEQPTLRHRRRRGSSQHSSRPHTQSTSTANFGAPPSRRWIYLSVSLFACAIMLTPSTRYQLRAIQNVRLRLDYPLKVLTLTYDERENKLPLLHIAHNCRMISRTRHRFIIYTDDTTAAYCRVCECRLFVKSGCRCPEEGADACKTKNLCEKLQFIVDSVALFGEFVFLDNDLIVLKEYFLDMLHARAQMHDFLASYGHTNMSSAQYRRNFNSGLMFVRRVDGLDYGRLMEMMYERKSQNDQGILSDFVQMHYDNWDSLSWKWHCRKLKRNRQDVPAVDCFTLHDRFESGSVLDELSMSLLTV